MCIYKQRGAHKRNLILVFVESTKIGLCLHFYGWFGIVWGHALKETLLFIYRLFIFFVPCKNVLMWQYIFRRILILIFVPRLSHWSCLFLASLLKTSHVCFDKDRQLSLCVTNLQGWRETSFDVHFFWRAVPLSVPDWKTLRGRLCQSQPPESWDSQISRHYGIWASYLMQVGKKNILPSCSIHHAPPLYNSCILKIQIATFSLNPNGDSQHHPISSIFSFPPI